MDTQTINFDEFKIRHIEDNNAKWFVAKDICKILQLKNITESLKNIKKEYKKYYKIKTNGGIQNMIILNLNGLQNLLQNSRSINKHKIISALNIDIDIIYDCKESSYLRIISSSFKCFSQIFQHQIGQYRIDLYFPEYKLAIEVDEFGHKDRCHIYEQERQKYLEKYLDCKFIRFNPDEDNFNIGTIIAQILQETYILPKVSS